MAHAEDMIKLADEYCAEGRQAFFENRLNEAALLVQNAIHLYKKCETHEKCTAALNLMGAVYAATGNEMLAVDYYLEGLASAIDYGCNNIITLFYNNIGSRYQELGEHEKAIHYFLKGAKELENPECMKEERHDNWCLVTYLNMALSYCRMEDYALSEKYLHMALPYMTGENGEIYRYTFLILQCQLWWETGRGENVRLHMEELLESGAKNSNAAGYSQDTRDLCSLLKKMGEYDNWKHIIFDFEKYVNEQNTVYFRLMLNEMWMDYYKTIGARDIYVGLCVEQAELQQKQQRINRKERASAIELKIQLREKEEERRRAENFSTTDALTGLGNRYLLAQDVENLVKQAAQKTQKITVGLLDIDCFKQHNDTYGHIKGDGCLKTVAGILQDAVCGIGKAYRFGGDEFVVILPSGEREQTERLAGRIQKQIKAAKIENRNSVVLPELTISQGYACFVPKPGEDEDDLIEHADDALYYVKKNGRNAYHIIEE